MFGFCSISSNNHKIKDSTVTFNKPDQHASRIFDVFKTGHFFGNKKAETKLKEHLGFCNKIELGKELDDLFGDLVRIESLNDVMKILHRLAEADVIPSQVLDKVIQQKHGSYKSAVETAKGMFYKAKHYLDSTKVEHVSLHARLSAVVDQFINLLESILDSFGIAEFFKPSENTFQAQLKATQITMLLSLGTMLTELCVPLAGATVAAWIVGGLLLSIAALSLIYPCIRSAPSQITPFDENKSKQAQLGELDVIACRKEILNQIAGNLTGRKPFPLIIGDSGQGKTKLIDAFTKAINDGEYPELKGKKVHYFNFADFLKEDTGIFSDGKAALQKIKERIKGFNKDYILVFDEFHNAYKTNDGSPSPEGESLKTLLDKEFPYFIGITTMDEYNVHIVPNLAGDNRFVKIAIESTGPSETQKIIETRLFKKAPEVPVANGALRYLVAETEKAYPGYPQPSKSLDILEMCIKRTSSTQMTSTKKTIEQKEKEVIEALYPTAPAPKNKEIESETSDLLGLEIDKVEVIEDLEEELAKLSEDLKSKEIEMAKLLEIRSMHSKTKESIYRTAVKINKLYKDALGKNQKKLSKDQYDAFCKNHKTLLNEFNLLAHFYEPALYKHLRKKAQDMGVTATIDKDLIDQALKDKKDEELKLQEGTKRSAIKIQAKRLMKEKKQQDILKKAEELAKAEST